MSSQSLLIQDRFSNQGPELRRHFEKRFVPSEIPDADRFVWDWWHVPDQYTLLRTPAYHYFPQSLYMKLHKQLVHWGRKNLGCWDITPPWLSCYVEGCKQELHADVPHGPWAFVYSLSPKDISFTGGETLLLKPETLNYWQNFSRTQNRELNSFVERIPAHFNRLVVFDPRIPHGVTEVHGPKDPREGRLVIHGWFTTPKTYLEGALAMNRTKSRQAEKILNQAVDQVITLASSYEEAQGVMSVHLKVSASGRVVNTKFKTNSLLTPNGHAPGPMSREILKIYRQLQFEKSNGVTDITVPLVFSAP